MALAKKCDRCGVFYEKNIRYPRMVDLCKATLTGVCFSTDYDEVVNDMDLCDDCLSKVINFLHNPEEDEK